MDLLHALRKNGVKRKVFTQFTESVFLLAIFRKCTPINSSKHFNHQFNSQIIPQLSVHSIHDTPHSTKFGQNHPNQKSFMFTLNQYFIISIVNQIIQLKDQ